MTDPEMRKQKRAQKGYRVTHKASYLIEVHPGVSCTVATIGRGSSKLTVQIYLTLLKGI